MTTYEFWTLDGDHLENITTDQPENELTELSISYNVHVENITWEEYDAAEWGEA